MFKLQISRKTQAPQVVITSPFDLIGKTLQYRDENGFVFPGIRSGFVEAVEFRNDMRYPIGFYFKMRDCEITRHSSWVYDCSIRWNLMPYVYNEAAVS